MLLALGCSRKIIFTNMTVPVSNTCGNFVCCYVDVIFNILL